MLTGIIGAVIAGLGGLLFRYFANRKAAADAAKAATLEALNQGQAQAQAAETKILKAVTDARQKPIDPMDWSGGPGPDVDGVRIDPE